MCFSISVLEVFWLGGKAAGKGGFSLAVLVGFEREKVGSFMIASYLGGQMSDQRSKALLMEMV